MQHFRGTILLALIASVLLSLFLNTGITEATTQANCSGWNIVASPNLGSNSNALNSVAAVSTNNVWAVGQATGGKISEQTLIEHWNGSSWSVIASPNPGTVSNVLYSVSAISSNDIWASGTYLYGNNNFAGFVEHWDGSQWSIVPSPNSLTLNAITAISSNDVWAVGININNRSTGAEHWDGSQWSVVPSRGGFGSDFSSVTAISSNNVWAVGSIENKNTQFQTLTEHWDGSHWYIKASPNMPPANNTLFAVTHIPGRGTLWTVGSYDPANTLTEFHC